MDTQRTLLVVVVDVGNRIELYAKFSRSGATYTPSPDPRSHRIALKDLNQPEILDRLPCACWRSCGRTWITAASRRC